MLSRAESKATGGQWGGEGGSAVPEPLGSEPGPQSTLESKQKEACIRGGPTHESFVHAVYVWGKDAS